MLLVPQLKLPSRSHRNHTVANCGLKRHEERDFPVDFLGSFSLPRNKRVVLADVLRHHKPERGYIRMFPGTKNRNEGTFGCSLDPKNCNKGTFAKNRPSMKPPFYFLSTIAKDPAILKTLRDSELLRCSVFLLRPPDLLRCEPFFERKNVCNSQENGVRTRYAAIVNHYATVNLLRRVSLLRRSIFSTAGSFGILIPRKHCFLWGI